MTNTRAPRTRFPKPLLAGDTIAITAPSSGVHPRHHARLDIVLNHLRAQGFRVIEGQCLRREHKSTSASPAARAKELMDFFTRPDVNAVFPPWGGELAIEILPLLDFDLLAAMPPKWLLGYSDVSTISLPLTLVAGWATAHGSNLMDLAPQQSDPLTSGVMGVLAAPPGSKVVQESSTHHQAKFTDFATHPEAALNLTEPTCWKLLGPDADAFVSMSGRLIGGCLDTVSRLTGLRCGDVPGFVQAQAQDGVILYLENVEMAPCELSRALWSLRMHRWFDGLSGLLIGRSAAPDAKQPEDRCYMDALKAVLGDLPFPVLTDVDIGHRPPQFTLINGALAHVEAERGAGRLVQTWE